MPLVVTGVFVTVFTKQLKSPIMFVFFVHEIAFSWFFNDTLIEKVYHVCAKKLI